jgi:hypothetical protein
MTVNILAEAVEISIEDGYWRLYERTEKLLPSLLFEVIKGRGFLQYSPTYGQKVGLPGTKFSASYIRAVVIGYESKVLRWMLGFHLSKDADEKPHWLALVRWESAANHQHAADVQQAGRILAEYLGCPLKIFGVKRLPQQPKKTGPIETHSRKDIAPHLVQRKVTEIYLPIEHKNAWLGAGRGNKLTLRIAGSSDDTAGKVAPAYQLVEFSDSKEVIKLVPPTGLLGAFFGGVRGREIPFENVRNVELRHIIDTVSTTEAEKDGDMLMEVSTTRRTWGIYLTLADENLLLVTTSHTTDSELSRQRLQKTSTGSSKRATAEFTGNVNYFRQVAEQSQQLESAQAFADSAAYLIAGKLNCRLVLTQLGDEIS